MQSRPAERRRVQRVRLLTPLRGSIGDQPIFVVDVSVRGLRVAHQTPLGPAGQRCRVVFDWEGSRVELACEIRWTAAKKKFYQSGLSVQDVRTIAAGRLRSLVEHYVCRALDEQRANARGIPAEAAQSYQSATATAFVRHQFIGGNWRETETTDPRQPITGFTISSTYAAGEVELLRSAYVTGDSAMRDTIRQMAAITVSNPDGVPARRYQP